MGLYTFGQPHGGIIQTAYVVADIHDAMEKWRTRLNVGPWFLLDHFTGEEATYRGGSAVADIAIAMGFAGHMQIELLQPNDDHPSVYKETIEERGYGFHHFGKSSLDYAADLKAYKAHGYELAFEAKVPSGGLVGYLDTKGELPGFLELIEDTPGLDEMFSSFYQASLVWDGKDPVRSMLTGEPVG